MPITRGGLPQPVPIKELSSDPTAAANKSYLYARQRGAVDAVLETVRGDGRRAILSAYGDITDSTSLSAQTLQANIFGLSAADPFRLAIEWYAEVTVAAAVTSLTLGILGTTARAKGSHVTRVTWNGTTLAQDLLVSSAPDILLGQLRASTDGPKISGRIEVVSLGADGATEPAILCNVTAYTVARDAATTDGPPISTMIAIGAFRLDSTAITGFTIASSSSFRPFVGSGRTGIRVRRVG